MQKRERISVPRAKWLLNNMDQIPIDNKNLDTEYDPYNLLEKYLKKALQGKEGRVTVTYKHGKGHTQGRIYPLGGVGLANLSKKFRNFLGHGIYDEIDIVNCFPTLLAQIMKKMEIESNTMEDYVKNREKYFEFLQNNHDLDRDRAKVIMLGLIFNAGVPTSEVTKNIKQMPDWMEKYCSEIKDVISKLKVQPEYEDVYEEVKQRKGNKLRNLEGSFLSEVLGIVERKLIVALEDYLKLKKFNVGCYIHDAVLIDKFSSTSNVELIDVIEKAEQYIETETGWKVSLKYKPIVSELEFDDKQTIAEKEDGDMVTVIETDHAGALILMEAIGKNVCSCNNTYYFKKNNIWQEDNSASNKCVKHWLFKHANSLNLYRQCGKDLKNYSKEANGAKRIADCAFSLISDDPNFKKKLWSSNLGYIFFNNGVYDVRNKKFTEGEIPGVYSIISTERNYNPAKPEIKQLVKEKLFDKILWEDEVCPYFLNWISRGIAGEFTEKTWGVGLGQRNSGKSTINKALKGAFGQYIGTFSANSWIAKDRRVICSKDDAQVWAWVKDLEFTRINFSQELPAPKNDVLCLDGTIPKKIASGGDEILCRLVFKNQQSIIPQGRFLLMLNEIGEIYPTDAKQTAVFFTYKTIFNTTITEEEEKINKVGNFRYYLADSSLDGWLKSPDVLDAITEIIFESYTPTPINMPECVKDQSNEYAEEESTSARIKSILQITHDSKDKITIKDIKIIFDEAGIKLSSQKRKSELVSLGVIYSKNNGGYFSGIKKIETE